MARTKQQPKRSYLPHPHVSISRKRPAGLGVACKVVQVPKRGPKVHRKLKPGTKALRDIKKLQKSTEFMLRKAPFEQLCKEVAHDKECCAGDVDFRFTDGAKKALQELVEAHMQNVFSDGYLCAIDNKRVTLTEKNLLLATRIRGNQI
jgi:histone H3/H4